eukprot:1162147-Pelagomonas_calceolata.AAC.13
MPKKRLHQDSCSWKLRVSAGCCALTTCSAVCVHNRACAPIVLAHAKEMQTHTRTRPLSCPSLSPSLPAPGLHAARAPALRSCGAV